MPASMPQSPTVTWPQPGVVADDTVIADETVVRQVAVGHDETVLANPWWSSGPCCPVDGDKFADGGIVADLHGGLFPVFQILRNGGDHGAGKYAAVLADAGAFHDG